MELLILFLLQIKHWYIDFVNQSVDEIKYKGVYLDRRGLTHSVKHSIATVLIFAMFAPWQLAIALGILDLLAHYHIDWIKMKWGTKDTSTKLFWNQFGLDQLAHQTTYLVLVLMFKFY